MIDRLRNRRELESLQIKSSSKRSSAVDVAAGASALILFAPLSQRPLLVVPASGHRLLCSLLMLSMGNLPISTKHALTVQRAPHAAAKQVALARITFGAVDAKALFHIG